MLSLDLTLLFCGELYLNLPKNAPKRSLSTCETEEDKNALNHITVLKKTDKRLKVNSNL